MRQWWLPRRINLQKSRSWISPPRLRAFSISNSPPRPRSSHNSIRQSPVKSNHRSQQHTSLWTQAFDTTKIARWRSRSQTWSIVAFGWDMLVFGTTLYYFALEQVPITGRRRLRSLSSSWWTVLDEGYHNTVEKIIHEYEGKFFTKDEYPGIQTLKAVLERLVKASGLDSTVCDVRVTDEPGTFHLKAVLHF